MFFHGHDTMLWVVICKTISRLGWTMKVCGIFKKKHITHLMNFITYMLITMLLSYNMKKDHNSTTQCNKNRILKLTINCIKCYFSKMPPFSSLIFINNTSTYNTSFETIDISRKSTIKLTNFKPWNSSSNELHNLNSSILKT
jgi:hypothetical protein